jgi:hypothetical protein
MLKKRIKLLTLLNFLWLPTPSLSSAPAVNYDTDSEDDKISNLIASLPADLIARVENGQMTSDDLLILANLDINANVAVPSPVLLRDRIVAYLIKKRQRLIERDAHVEQN